MKANDVLAWQVAGESEAALGAVLLGQEDFVVGIPDLDVHSNAGTRRQVIVYAPIKQLDFVVADEDGFVGDFFDEAFLFRFADMEVKSSRGWNQHDAQNHHQSAPKRKQTHLQQQQLRRREISSDKNVSRENITPVTLSYSPPHVRLMNQKFGIMQVMLI